MLAFIVLAKCVPAAALCKTWCFKNTESCVLNLVLWFCFFFFLFYLQRQYVVSCLCYAAYHPQWETIHPPRFHRLHSDHRLKYISIPVKMHQKEPFLWSPSMQIQCAFWGLSFSGMHNVSIIYKTIFEPFVNMYAT